MAEMIQPIPMEDIQASQMDKQSDPTAIVSEMQKNIDAGRKSAQMVFRDARDVALLHHGIYGSDAMQVQREAFQMIKSGSVDAQELKNQMLDQYTQMLDQHITDTIRASAASDDPEVRQATVNLVTGRKNFLQSEIDAALDYDGVAQNIMELYAGESADEFSKRQQGMAYAAMQKVDEYGDQQGTLQTVTDFLISMFPLDTWKDWADIAGGNSLVMSAEEFTEEVKRYQALDPEEQFFVFPSLFERITRKNEGNLNKIRRDVAILHSPDAAGEARYASFEGFLASTTLPWDIELAGAVVKGGARLLSRKGKEESLEGFKANSIPDQPEQVVTLKETINQQSVAHQMDRVDNPQAAAEAMTVAGMDHDAAKFLGNTQLDAADTAAPFRNNELPIVIGSISTIADDMVRIHRAGIEEHLVAQNLKRAQAAREGDTAVMEAANRNLEKLPRKEARLKTHIKVLARTIDRIKKSKPTKNNAEVQGLLSKMQDELSLSVQKLAVTRGRIKAAEETLEGRKVIDRPDYEILMLEAGRLPATLADQVRGVVSRRYQEVVGAQQKVSKRTQEAQTEAASSNHGLGVDGEKLLSEVELSTTAARILDDPIRYGVSEEAAQEIAENIRLPLQDLIAETDSIALQKITPTRQQEIQQKVRDRIIDEAKKSGDEVRSAEIIDATDEGFTVVYNTRSGENTLPYSYKLSDVGVFEGEGLVSDSMFSYMEKILSPSTLFGDLGRFVNNLTFAGDQSAKIAKRLQDMHRSIHKGLSTKQKSELDQLLIAGDETPNGRVWTVEELEAGVVELKGSIKPHDPAVIKAYYQMRAFYDEMHDMRDYFIRKDLKFAGYKDVSYVDDAGETVHFIARPLDDFRGQDLKDEFSIFVPGRSPEDSKYMSLAQIRENLQVWKDEGYELLEMFEPHKSLRNGKEEVVTKFALITKADNVATNPLPKKVLNYRPGYIPRVYKSGYSFVKSYVNPARPVTLFATETHDDAVKFADQLQGFSQGGDNVRAYVAKRDRELTQAERVVMDADSFGGLYTGSRSRRDIMVRTTDGAYRPERVGNGEATARYMANLANLMPVAEYRHALMRQWANTVDELGAQERRIGLKDKTDFNSDIDLSDGKKRMMEAARDYLNAQLKLQTDEEKTFARAMNRLSDAMYSSDAGKARQMARALVRGMIDKDPIQQLKGITFNLQLGMFNPRQLIMQAQNAAIAVSVSPQHAPGAITDALFMRALVYSKNQDIPETLKALAKVTGRDAGELTEILEDFRRTGLWDSIKRTADFDADVVNLGGNTIAAMRKVASGGRIFFREGELMARLVSFNIARRRLGKGASAQELFDEHLRLSMNMQSANAAVWQKNFLGLPLQYMQVFTKFYENLIFGLMNKGKWNQKEALSILVGQGAIYGTVGVPAAEGMYAYVAEQFGITPKEAKENYPWIEKTATEGIMGFIASILGMENAFSKDLSIIGGTASTMPAELLKSALGLKDGTLDVNRVIAGPSISTITRTKDALMQSWDAAVMLASDPSLEVLGDTVLQVADGFAGMTSTWSNARKTLFLHDIGVVSRQGNTLIDAQMFSDLNWQTTFASYMGYQTDIEADYWSLKETNRSSKARQKEDLEVMKKIHLNYMKGGSHRAYKTNIALLKLGKTDQEWSKLKESMLNGLTGDSDYDRQAKMFLDTYIRTGGRDRLHPATATFGEN